MVVELSVQLVYVIAIICWSISLVLIIPLFISLLATFYCNHAQQQEIHRCTKYSTICTFTFTILYIIMSILFYLHCILNKWEWVLWIADSQTLCFIGLILSMYIFLLFRLYHTFEGSVYQIKPAVVITHCGCIFIIVTLTVFAALITSSFISLLLFGFALIIMVLGYIYLLYTFNDNLFSLILSQTVATINQNVEVNERKFELLSVIRKQMVLATF